MRHCMYGLDNLFVVVSGWINDCSKEPGSQLWPTLRADDLWLACPETL